MYYIGISAYYHESSIFLTDNKKTNCFLKEESFSRIKGDKNFPKKSLEFIKKKYNLADHNIKFICFYEKPFKSWWDIFYYSIKNPIQNRNLLIHHLKNFNQGSIFFFSDLKKILDISKDKIIYSSHHLSHCLFGLTMCEKFDEYVFLTCDGVGEGETMSIFTISQDYKIKKLWSKLYPNSIGLFYSTITDFLGFQINEGEFKVMSLSSFGKPIYEKEFKEIFNIENFSMNMKYFNFHKDPSLSFSPELSKIIGKPYLDLDDKKIFQHYSNIAASIQKILELTIENLIKKAIGISNKKKVILTGGVGLNCKMIYNLAKKNIFDELIVPPSPGDSGSAIGAANFAVLIENKYQPIRLNNFFLGPEKNQINSNEIKSNFFTKIDSDDEFLDETVKKLISGEIIATYFDKNEIGPRSLGNTSLICNAKDIDVVNNLNTKIKKRNKFQPLAPILLEEDFDKYFFLQNNVKRNLLWMGTLCDAKEFTYNNYKSIIHIDGTSRVQTINNPQSLIHQLLKKLKLNGSDILVNTSFNITKDPIVFDLFDVYVNLKRMDLYFVLMDDGLYKIKQI
jgi:carbamoyltransferase